MMWRAPSRLVLIESFLHIFLPFIFAGKVGGELHFVTDKTYKAWSEDEIRPYKALLFRSPGAGDKSAMPSILIALATHPDFAPHVSFGQVLANEKELAAKFNIKSRPAFVLTSLGQAQYAAFSDRGSPMTFLSVANWLRQATQNRDLSTEVDALLHREQDQAMKKEFSVAEGTELSTNRATPLYAKIGSWDHLRLLPKGHRVVAAGTVQRKFGFSWVPIVPKGALELDATVLGDIEPEVDGESLYQMYPFGSSGCPEELAIQTSQECRTAIEALGMDSQPPWISNYPEVPPYCSVRVQLNGNQERMHFNSASSGAGRDDLAPICRRPAASTAPVAKSADASEASFTAESIREAVIAKVQAALDGNPSDKNIDLMDQIREAVLAKLKPDFDTDDASPQQEAERANSKTKLAPSKKVDREIQKKRKVQQDSKRSSKEKGGKDADRHQMRQSSSYKMLEYGTQGCEEGLEITSVKECEKAIASLGLKTGPAWVSAYPGLPSHCSVRETPTKDAREQMHFNSAKNGQARRDLAPVCRKAPASAPPPIMELSALTKADLLHDIGFKLIYLCKGPITSKEVAMLVAAREKFNRKVPEHAGQVQWMWLNTLMERKLQAIFDAPVLPSAVMLAHFRDKDGVEHFKYSLLQHGERDGDVLPADASMIELLLNMVLGGDAEFETLPAAKLKNYWSKRNADTK